MSLVEDSLQVMKLFEELFDMPYTGSYPDTPQTDRRVAYHEAGHAVVAAVLGYAPIRVTVVRDGDCMGKVTVQAKFSVEENAAYLLAGSIAEVRSQQRAETSLSCVVNCARGDIEELRKLQGNDEPLDIEAALRLTGEILSHNWQRVERIAEGLLTTRTLDTIDLMEHWHAAA